MKTQNFIVVTAFLLLAIALSVLTYQKIKLDTFRAAQEAMDKVPARVLTPREF